MGADKIDPRIMRELAGVVPKPITIIFEKSRQSCKVPSDWKRGNVIPISEKGKKEEAEDYQRLTSAW